MTAPDKLLSFEGRHLDELDAQELLLIAKETVQENERLRNLVEQSGQCIVELSQGLQKLSGVMREFIEPNPDKHSDDSLGSPVKYTDGSYSREYDEQPKHSSDMVGWDCPYCHMPLPDPPAKTSGDKA